MGVNNPYLNYVRIQYHLPDGTVTRDPNLAFQANSANLNARQRRQDRAHGANGAAGTARDARSSQPLLPVANNAADWESPLRRASYPAGGYLHVIA